jgi:hypothetical protein
MNTLKRKARFFLVLMAVLFFQACDMEYILPAINGGQNDAPSPLSPDEEERALEELKNTGHYLQLLHLPRGTLAEFISAVAVSDGGRTVAHLTNKTPVLIESESSYSNAYLPLAVSGEQDFTRTGQFYVAFTVNIDALTKIIVPLSSRVLVEFTGGHGILDIEKLVKEREDVVIVDDDPESEEKIDEQIEDIINSGGYIKFVNLPRNISNIAFSNISVSSASVLAQGGGYQTIAVKKQTMTSDAYVPLTPRRAEKFSETGTFYTAFTITVDALTQITSGPNPGILVYYQDGAAEIDVSNLPSGNQGTDPGGGDDTLDDFKKNERYLTLMNLPQGTLAEHISGLNINDGSRPVARPSGGVPLIEKVSVYSNAYLPLTTPGGQEFTRTGQFYVAFTVQVDALTKIVVTANHKVLVQFTEGRGVLDIEKLIKELDDVVVTGDDPEIDEQIDNIINSGGYIKFVNLPWNASKTSFTNVTVSSSSIIARCSDYEAIAVKKNAVTSEAYVPLAPVRSSRFTETGSFLITFSINADALTQIIVDSSNAILCAFQDGAGEIDIVNIPPPPGTPPIIPHCLTIYGIPPTAQPSNFSDVLIYNSSGIAAKCPDYTKITIQPFSGQYAAIIPLVYDNNRAFNGQDFADSGILIVAFTFVNDAVQSVVITPKHNLLAEFSNGSGIVNINDTPAVPHNYFTISGLPPNTQELNISDVFIWDQSGKIGKCEDYNLVLLESTDTSSTLKIPLMYTEVDRIFEETGHYYVSFDLNIDALTRILIDDTNKVLVTFAAGNGILDAGTLTALPVPYLTIIGLPYNTARGNFADVFAYNAVGKVAKCADYQEIIITKNSNSASAMIPLVYNDNSKEYFRDSGEFVVTYTINVDINTQIIKTRDDAQPALFTDGSAEINLSFDHGYFSGGLLNPNDTAPPVIARGTIFEINGSYAQIKTNTPVSTITVQKTSLVYIYAGQNNGSIEFEYSTAAPVFNTEKNGYYLENKRALYKLVYIKDTVDRYFAKTYIADSFTHLNYFTLSNYNPGGLTDIVYSLSGNGNPYSRTLTLSPGAYLISLTGAGGGGGGGIDGVDDRNRHGGVGGDGGFISELVIITETTSVTVFTGQGGNGSAAITWGQYQGAGGGGGGSGTFVYTPLGYFLTAGGGGGGGGGGANDGGGGGGGAGGSGGAGGAGGKGGDDAFIGIGSAGGSGGGAPVSYTVFPSGFSWGYNGQGHAGDDGGKNGGPGVPAAFKNLTYDFWSNTNDANGQGGDGSHWDNGKDGGHGGNNRTTTRGGGSPGGTGGVPSDSQQSAGTKGGNGSIQILRVF